MFVVDVAVQQADGQGLDSPSQSHACKSALSRSMSNGCRMFPCASIRPRASITCSVKGRCFSMARANRSGRSCSPIRSTSPNPSVTSKAVGAPCRVNSALVPRVVPRRTSSGGSGSDNGVSRRSRVARTGASIPATSSMIRGEQSGAFVDREVDWSKCAAASFRSEADFPVAK